MRRSLFRPQRCDAIPAQFVALWKTREPAVLFQQLKDQHHLLKSADLQGNTLLHYAVTTPPNGALIKFLLAVPVNLKAQNCAGETAADWLRPYIKSSKVLLDPTELDQLPERIAMGDSDFVTDLLIKEKISLRLRFSQGDTLLHLLIRHDQYKIVQQLISNTAGHIIEYLLKISNGVGETPLTILQAQLQQGKPEAQAAIDAALQQRNKETALPPCFPSVEAMISLLHLSVTNMEKLNKLFSTPVSVENFAQLQPNLPTLCVLAYRLCKSAGRALSSSSCEESYMLLLQQLFGQWHDSILVNLLSRINAIDRFISYIVSNNRVEQSIVLSAGNPDHTGWSDSSTAKIYLNPTGTAHLMDVLLTLLHEVSHQAVSSYDLVCEGRSIVKEDYYQINFKGCYDLATKGEGIASLSEECMDLLSVYWQLESGEVTDGSKLSLLKLYQKFALNNADSLAIAILGLAAFNSGYATLDEENHILQIDQQFLFRSCLATSMANEPPMKVIVDVDAGVDDAMALLLLLAADSQKDIEILGITCCHGNTSVNNVCINVLRLLEASGRSDIPVYRGAEEPLIVHDGKYTEESEHFHGMDGFGDLGFLHTPSMKLIQSENAVSALGRIVAGADCKGEVRLVCLAPLTNIALTMKTYAHFSNSLKDIYVMGGNSTGMGNVTSTGEFNFYTDPEAAHIVLTSARCPIYLLPWETCLSIDISLAWRFNVLGATQNTQMDLLNIVEKKVWEKSSYTSWIPCDAILAAVLLRPDIVIKSQKCHATVELHGAHTRGQVVIDHLKVKDPNVHLIEEFDTSILKKMLLWAAGHADLDYDKSK